MHMGKTAYLVLENGKTFRGETFGAEKELTGEVVFSTSMTGYLETLTDPSYWGQFVVQTFPQIGNYGVISADLESDMIGPKAYIVKQWCQAPSNFRSEGSLDTFFEDRDIVGLCGIDTRALTRILRESGVMNGIITSDPAKVDLAALKAHKTKGAVRAVSTKHRYTVGDPEAKLKLAMIDFGLKKSIYQELTRRGAKVVVCPCTTTAQEIREMNVDGVVLSSGAGDPEEDAEFLSNVKEISELKLPTFAICLGHLLLAKARGCEVEKMKYGHRGENQPVKNMETGRVYITAQSHGYAVVSDSIASHGGKELYKNVNDGSCEGIRYSDIPALSVQFHPEACGGPEDTHMMFDEFFTMLQSASQSVKGE